MQIAMAIVLFLLSVLISPLAALSKHAKLSELSRPQTAEEWYKKAQIQIKEGKREEARASLEEALSLDPDFAPAKIQLGFLDLWEGDLSSSYGLFLSVLESAPCDLDVLEGLSEIGSRWRQVEKKQAEVAEIYGILNRCEPNNTDTLFYLGRALAKSGQWEEAESVLKKCLALAPHHSDAEVQLAYLYLWQGQWDKAEALFALYPENREAKLGLALAAQGRGDHAKAKRHLQEITTQNPTDREARRKYAKLLHENMDYSEAETEFAWLVDDDPNTSDYWLPLFDIKSHTRYGFMIETLYTYAKEDDPSLKAPVVKDYYFYNALHFLIPVMDRWRLDLKELYYHQRENEIFPPVGVNYSVYLSGGQITSSYFFAKDWRWDLSLRAFHAWGAQNARYPFRSTNRFEPGTGLLYNSERQLFSLDVHTESFVIKNFAENDSSLLRTDYLTGGYAYRFGSKFRPELEARVSHIFIRDNLKNWENTEQATARFRLFSEYLTAIYRFEHGHFDRLSQNYSSFKQQLRNVLGGQLHVPISGGISWDTVCYHRWQTTYDLFQPIGNTVFIASEQYLVANWVTSSLSIRYRDKVRFELEGHYFHDTLPYRDWGVRGSFLWQF